MVHSLLVEGGPGIVRVLWIIIGCWQLTDGAYCGLQALMYVIVSKQADNSRHTVNLKLKTVVATGCNLRSVM